MSGKGQLSRRSFLAITGAIAAKVAVPGSLLVATPAPATPPRAGAQSLAGQWQFALDRDDRGVKESWFAQELKQPAEIALPGILQTQGYGDDIEVTTQFIAALPRDMAWYKLPQYAAYTKPGRVQVPYLSQPVKHYLGVAWYQREIEIPARWDSKRIALTLERTRWQTNVYLDGKEIGSCHSLVAPHEYDFGVLRPGRHRLSIRIDNRMILPYRFDGHGVSDGEGSTWNGIVGRIELAATSPVWIDDAQVFPNLTDKSAHIKVRVGNATGKAGAGTLSVGATIIPVTWDAAGGEGAIDVKLPGAVAWSEFTPALQKLTVRLTGPFAEDHREVTFGLREIKTDGKLILLNGELFQLRATHDGGGFPLTGYPATDVETWKRIIGVCKQWGLNGIRFHSWCPPEAAFTAADELGFYLQPECGMWNSFDAEGKMLAVLNDETARIVKAYGNHPSFVLLNATNEPAGHYQEQLPTWDERWREADPRRLYSDGTGRFAPPPAGWGTPFAADYLVTGAARGPRGWFGADYENFLKTFLHNTSIPAVGHEVGQWCAYPDFDVIEKFSDPARRVNFPRGKDSGRTPYMVPGNYRIWRDSAEQHGLLARNKELAHASGRFQVACYKEEIEANLRTPSYSGYELLDLHDYLGQGGALIGVLDAFWEEKGYVRPAEFRQFNNQTVPLVRLKERVYSTGDNLNADVEVAHFGHTTLANASSGWQIVGAGGQVISRGSLGTRSIPRGKGISLGRISVPLTDVAAPAQYRLILQIASGVTRFQNEWNFWVYPEDVASTVPAGVLVTRSWDEAQQNLNSGGKVLFLPDLAATEPYAPKLSTVPIFWNRLMNPNGTWFLGLWNNATHPALAGFPTQSNCDWQWVDLLPNARALVVDELPRELQPIVQPIDDWNRNFRLAMLYECAMGAGKLMVCSLDLDADKPGARSLRRSILDYMASTKFNPAVTFSAAALRKQWTGAPPVQDMHQPPASTSPDLVDPGQVRRRHSN